MTVTLELNPAFELRLRERARQRGLSPDAYAKLLLQEQLQSEAAESGAVALLQSWIDDGDAAEQRDTAEFLLVALDEDRPADRQLFPEHLRGVTW